jgi:hypothetical protein
MQNSIMGMDFKGMEIATWHLRDKIYSNKIKAVVREYLCNAIDEHNKFGIKTAVQTGIRVENNENIFYVRDFANGLSEEDIRSIFGMYFRSTKSKSNDSIGGFGVGSKAGHCYNDTFFVTSYFQNKKTVYTCVLGGGDNGVPVGHIYKIDESDCEETGLEISVPVKQSDSLSFAQEIKDFISFSPANIHAEIRNEIITPNKLIKSFESNGLKFRLIENGSIKRASGFIVQMGGVKYGEIYCKDFSAIADAVLVVDVPIGSMSIPISREGFEETMSNKNFFSKIEKTIEELAEKDLAQFKTKNARELIEDDLADLSNPFYEGNFFAAKKSVLFKDIYRTMSKTKKVDSQTAICKKGGQPILLVCPHRSNSCYWMNKIENHCKKTGENYYVVLQNDLYYPHTNIEKIKECFAILCIKRVKYEKQLSGANKLYTVYARSGTKLSNAMSPLDLHNYRCQLLKMPEAKNADEAIAQTEKYFKNCKSYDDILLFSISIREGRPYCFQSNSILFIKEMVKLGWIDRNSEEAQKIRENFNKIEEESKEKLQIRRTSIKKWIDFSPRTREALKKDKNTMKLHTLWKRIEQESSLRSKIISSLNTDYYSANKYSRQEIRTIMKLK